MAGARPVQLRRPREGDLSWPIDGIWFDWIDLCGLSDVDRTYRLSEKCILMASGEMFRR